MSTNDDTVDTLMALKGGLIAAQRLVDVAQSAESLAALPEIFSNRLQTLETVLYDLVETADVELDHLTP